MKRLLYRKEQSKGFTLVELLVVVSIIAILSVIGLTIFTSAQANARDARRKADIDAIANTIEATRAPATVFYLSLPSTGFSGSTVPMDNNNSTTASNYCIMTSTGTSVPGDPTTWTSTSSCPTAPAGGASGLSVWTTIPAAGLTAGTAPFVASTISWKVCARLETGTPYCKPSSQ